MSTPEAARALLEHAGRAYADDPAASRVVAELRERLDEPLRVAVAGKVKAGKSTLLNALLGEEVAATDAGECTRVTTWYRHGTSPSAQVVLTTGERQPLVLRRDAGRLVLDLAGRTAEGIERLEVTWPSPILAEMTLVDTPGLGSLTTEASGRTTDLLAPESGGAGIDALIYLLRHRNAADLETLEDFHRRTGAAGASPAAAVNVVGVLSRADELGGGGLDALARSRELAAAYATDARVQPLCRQVVPLGGLVAQGAQTLRQVEFETLRDLSRMSRERRESLLVSAQRFATAADPDVPPAERRAVLERLGLFGVRLAIVLVPFGHDDPVSLSAELLRRSGLPALRRIVMEGYSSSATVLKARTALAGLERLLRSAPCPGGDDLARRLEAVLIGAHDVRELVLRARLRGPAATGLDDAQTTAALRLAGADGEAPADRLGVADDPGQIEAAAEQQLALWRRVALDPMSTRTVREIAEALARTCEGLLGPAAELSPAAQSGSTAELSPAAQSGPAAEPSGSSAATVLRADATGGAGRPD